MSLALQSKDAFLHEGSPSFSPMLTVFLLGLTSASAVVNTVASTAVFAASTAAYVMACVTACASAILCLFVCLL